MRMLTLLWPRTFLTVGSSLTPLNPSRHSRWDRISGRVKLSGIASLRLILWPGSSDAERFPEYFSMNSSILVASRTNVSWKCNGVYGCIWTFLFLNSCLCFLFRSFKCSLYSLTLKLKFSSELFSFSQYLGLSIKFLERNNFPTFGTKTLQTELKFGI